MINSWSFWACIAGASALAGCSKAVPDGSAGENGASVTIELPEPTEAVEPPTLNIAADPSETDEPRTVEPSAAVEPAAEAKPVPKPAEARPQPKPVEKEAAPEKERDKEADAPVPAKPLPLPSATIVQAIERIGYRCGSISSSKKIDGVAGSSDYTINCSSGDSYRASNRSGRYRFSKTGG
jgi:hypothetical protein